MSKSKLRAEAEQQANHGLDTEGGQSVVAEFVAVDAEIAELPAPGMERASNDAAMQQMRELLFGAMIEELRSEFRRNARSVLQTVKSLHREFTQRNDELQQQIDALRLAGAVEVEQREQQCEALAELLGETNDATSAKFDEQQREQELAAGRLAADIKTHSRNQKRAMEELEFKLFGAIEDHSKELNKGKLNRDEFASLLSTLAGKVAGTRAANESEVLQRAKIANG